MKNSYSNNIFESIILSLETQSEKCDYELFYFEVRRVIALRINFNSNS